MNLPEVAEMSDAELLADEKKALGFYMSSHPLARHADLLQALATHKVADLAALPEKTEVILGGIIANVQARNVQKSRSGLTRMAKLTFEDLSGTTPAMLWPEEFAKMADLVKNDLIGWVKGTLDRRRDPAELVDQPDHPPGARARRADARRHRAAAQGSPPDRAPRALAPSRAHSPRQPRPLPRDRRARTGAQGRLQGRRVTAHPLRRPADPRTGSRRGPGPRAPARAIAAPRPGSTAATVLLLRRSLLRAPPRTADRARPPIRYRRLGRPRLRRRLITRCLPVLVERAISGDIKDDRASGRSGEIDRLFPRRSPPSRRARMPRPRELRASKAAAPLAVSGYQRSVHRVHRPWAILARDTTARAGPIKRYRPRGRSCAGLLQVVVGSRRPQKRDRTAGAVWHSLGRAHRESECPNNTSAQNRAKAAPGKPPTAGLKYERGTGIMTAIETAPSRTAATTRHLEVNLAARRPRGRPRAPATPNAGRIWRTPS